MYRLQQLTRLARVVLPARSTSLRTKTSAYCSSPIERSHSASALTSPSR
jgi:hypothetical protein